MKIGFIDWTESGLAIYIFEKNGSSYILTEKQSISLDGEPAPADLAQLVKAGIQDIHLSLPTNLLTLRELTFPFDERDKINDTIAFELEGVLLGSTYDYSIAHIVTESGSSGSKVLAVCLEKKKLQGIIEMFSAAGLDPKVITSLDIYMSGGKTEILLEESILNMETRAEAAANNIHPSINLRQDEMAYTGDIEKFRKQIRFTALLVLALVTILCLSTFISLMAEKNEYKALRSETESAYRTLFPEDRKIVDIERQLTGNINKLEQKKGALIGVPVLYILRTIAEQKNSGITLNEFNADGNNIIIKGTAGSFENVDSLKNKLLTVFQGVKVMDSYEGADKKIGFTIIMKEKDA